jgi:transcriptional regulator with XRE-family HTH domain
LSIPRDDLEFAHNVLIYLPELVVARRKELGILQQELADQVGITRSLVNTFEHRYHREANYNPTFFTMFGYLEWLIDHADDAPPPPPLPSRPSTQRKDIR